MISRTSDPRWSSYSSTSQSQTFWWCNLPPDVTCMLALFCQLRCPDNNREFCSVTVVLPHGNICLLNTQREAQYDCYAKLTSQAVCNLLFSLQTMYFAERAHRSWTNNRTKGCCTHPWFRVTFPTPKRGERISLHQVAFNDLSTTFSGIVKGAHGGAGRIVSSLSYSMRLRVFDRRTSVLLASADRPPRLDHSRSSPLLDRLHPLHEAGLRTLTLGGVRPNSGARLDATFHSSDEKRVITARCGHGTLRTAQAMPRDPASAADTGIHSTVEQ
ncbi:hypothetical protein C8Q80DRAFT_130524 [Daedaleopsis nitida]|nr:hypothetical protein C8Q80DRAFT_130524 [Daedaleopsis nitida]